MMSLWKKQSQFEWSLQEEGTWSIKIMIVSHEYEGQFQLDSSDDTSWQVAVHGPFTMRPYQEAPIRLTCSVNACLAWLQHHRYAKETRMQSRLGYLELTHRHTHAMIEFYRGVRRSQDSPLNLLIDELGTHLPLLITEEGKG